VKLYNRRSCLAALAAAGCYVGVNSFTRASVISGAGKQNGKGSRKFIIRPGHPLFDSTLSESFPGLTGLNGAALLLRSALIITNTSASPIQAYGLSWKYVANNQEIATFSRAFMLNPDQLTRSSLHTGQKPLLTPGAVALATPLFFMTEQAYKRAPSLPLSPSEPEINQNAQYFLGTIQSEGRVLSQVDARVYSNVAVGPSPYAAAMSFAVTRNAQHDEALSAYNIASNNPDLIPEQAVGLAYREARTTSFATSEDRLREYIARRAEYGVLLLTSQPQQSKSDFLVSLGKRMRMKKTYIKLKTTNAAWG
jgi:hypothetical protein